MPERANAETARSSLALGLNRDRDGADELIGDLGPALRGLTSEIETLEERVRGGDKGAYRTCKFQKLQLCKLRQERSEVERRLKRNGFVTPYGA